MEAAVMNGTQIVPPFHPAVTSAGNARTTILVAEDALDTRLILTRTLEFEEFNYIQAADGEEAIEKAIKYRPDIMLLDLMLPKLDGFQVLLRLKKLDLPTKVCIVSAVESEDFIRRALDFGASDYIVKPVIPDIVLHKIRSLTAASSQDQSYFRLPCSLSCRVVSDYKTYDGQICNLTEVGLTLRSSVFHRTGEVLSLQCPALGRIMLRDIPLLATVTGARRNGRHNERFDLEVEFVGLSENQRQRLRKEIIRGKFLTDGIHLQ